MPSPALSCGAQGALLNVGPALTHFPLCTTPRGRDESVPTFWVENPSDPCCTFVGRPAGGGPSDTGAQCCGLALGQEASGGQHRPRGPASWRWRQMGLRPVPRSVGSCSCPAAPGPCRQEEGPLLPTQPSLANCGAESPAGRKRNPGFQPGAQRRPGKGHSSGR